MSWDDTPEPLADRRLSYAESLQLLGIDPFDPDYGWDFTPGPDRGPDGPLEDF